MGELLKVVEGIEVVSTARFPSYSQLWAAKEQELEESSKTQRMARIVKVLGQVEDFAHSWSLNPGTKTAIPDAISAAEEPLALVFFSITFVSRFIRICLSEIYPGQDIPSPPGGRFFARSSFWETPWNAMISKGCCQSEVQLTRFRLPGPTFVLASFFERPYMSRSHHKCTKLECVAAQIDTTKYETQHVSSDCDCSFVKVAAHELANSLSLGRIPRIRIEVRGAASDNIRTSVVDEGPYVAISHVWSHGLGNQYSNSLPNCQLRRSKRHIDTLRHSLAHDCPLDIWIDTLCIPVQPQFKDSRHLAIQKLFRTFDDALAILVIDIELYTSSMQASFLEIGLRILFSAWQRRLWTLLEGVQGITNGRSKLHFQFLKGTIEYRDFMEIPKVDPTNLYLCKKLCRALESALPSFISIANRLDKIFYRLYEVSHGIKGRTTSRPTDEALCIALLIGLPAANILSKSSAPERMKELYLLIKYFPARIIFSWTLLPTKHHDGSWMNEIPGFGWAKRSIMTGLESLSGGLESEDRWATCRDDGLHRTYFGFVFSDIREAARLTIFIRDTSDDTRVGYVITAIPRPESEQQWIEACTQFEVPTRAALVFDGVDMLHSFRVALAVVQDEKNGVLYARSITRGQHRTFIIEHPQPVLGVSVADAQESENGGVPPCINRVSWVKGNFTTSNQ